jgi:hypothetical protein
MAFSGDVSRTFCEVFASVNPKVSWRAAVHGIYMNAIPGQAPSTLRQNRFLLQLSWSPWRISSVSSASASFLLSVSSSGASLAAAGEAAAAQSSSSFAGDWACTPANAGSCYSVRSKPGHRHAAIKLGAVDGILGQPQSRVAQVEPRLPALVHQGSNLPLEDILEDLDSMSSGLCLSSNTRSCRKPVPFKEPGRAPRSWRRR